MVKQGREKQKTQYLQIKCPQAANERSSFAICEKRLDGSWHTLQLEELEKVNQLYKSKVLTLTQATRRVKKIRDNLYKERDRDLNVWRGDNKALFDKFWESKYLHRPIISLNSAENDFKRVLNFLGEEISLVSTDRDIMQEFVNKLYPGEPNKLRALVSNINKLLLFAGRSFRIFAPKKQHNRVKYLTLSELRKVLPFIEVASKVASPEESTRAFRLFIQAAFFTGARTGEVLAIKQEDVHDAWVYIREQLDRKLNTRHTKTNRTRKSVIIPEGVEYLREFVNLRDDIKVWLRGLKNSNKLQQACSKADLPPNKQLKFHNLRASYCLHLLKNNVPPNVIADSIGDRLSTFEEHYKDYILEETRIMDTFKMLLPKQ